MRKRVTHWRVKGVWITATLAVCAVITAVVVHVAVSRRHAVLDRVYRVGVENNPPYMSVDANGNVSGLTVDVLNEAARRRGIQLQWIPQNVPNGLDATVGSGAVDLWPNAARTPARLAKFYVTSEWLNGPFAGNVKLGETRGRARRVRPQIHGSAADGGVQSIGNVLRNPLQLNPASPRGFVENVDGQARGVAVRIDAHVRRIVLHADAINAIQHGMAARHCNVDNHSRDDRADGKRRGNPNSLDSPVCHSFAHRLLCPSRIGGDAPSSLLIGWVMRHFRRF